MPQNISTVAQSSNIYYHKYRPLFFLMGLVLLMMAGWSFGHSSSLWPGLVLVLNATWILSLAQLLRIVITPDGIAYHNSGFYTIATPWDNVERITDLPFAGIGPVRCVVLRQSAVTGWTRLAWMLTPEQRRRTIPLSSGWAHLDELEQQVRHYAPHVAE
jgi:hypothetical protein